ncbi:MAG: hypothetical protein Q8J64_06525 [Thermodesulfovibrionales bacterium]|nr:hypothetical protein [Thermodesulfovibrionales bacterium]
MKGVDFATLIDRDKVLFKKDVYLKGDLLAGLPLSNRRGLLELAVRDYLPGYPFIEIARQVRVGKRKLFYESIEGENEGIVLKKLDSKYLVSDSRCPQNPFWLKVKRIENHIKIQGG